MSSSNLSSIAKIFLLSRSPSYSQVLPIGPPACFRGYGVPSKPLTRLPSRDAAVRETVFTRSNYAPSHAVACSSRTVTEALCLIAHAHTDKPVSSANKNAVSKFARNRMAALQVSPGSAREPQLMYGAKGRSSSQRSTDYHILTRSIKPRTSIRRAAVRSTARTLRLRPPVSSFIDAITGQSGS